MCMDNFWDKAAVRLRAYFMIGAVAAGPVALYSYAMMIVDAYQKWPAWAFVLAFFSHIVIFAGHSMREDPHSKRR